MQNRIQILKEHQTKSSRIQTAIPKTPFGGRYVGALGSSVDLMKSEDLSSQNMSKIITESI